MCLRKILTISALCILPLTATGGAYANGTSGSSVGDVDFPISCDQAVEDRFEHAVAMLHNMMYAQAEKEFRAVAETDPHCAMAWWGVAMTYYHPLWAPPSKADLEAGQKALNKALSLGAKTERERAYLAAAHALFGAWESHDHKTRLTNWEAAQRVIYMAWPDDLEAAALFGLARLATAPKADKSFTQQKEAGKLLEQLHAQSDEHPAGFHYVIHAYDNPPLADRALEAARGYDAIAPEVPHALHMPSHIFVRLGLWRETEEWNRRSAVAARKVSGETLSLHYVHALDYEMYATLQRAKDDRARELSEEAMTLTNVQDSFASAYGIAAMLARYPLERNDWNGAAALRVTTGFPWDKYPMYEAITWYARALGEARSGDLAAAKESVKKLDELHGRTVKSGQTYWAVVVDAQRQAAAAWVHFAGGEKEQALEMMAKAADLEDSVDKHPVTPGAVRPARELLGDMLLAMDQPAEALEAFAKALLKSPGRFNSLYGAARSAEEMKDSDKAYFYYDELLRIAGSGIERPELKHARTYLKR